MEEYRNRLTNDAKKLFETELPQLCQRFHNLLSEDAFSPDSVPTVKAITQNSCQKLIMDENKPGEEMRMKEKEKREGSGSDEEEFHTPMTSDSELESEPPRKKLKVKHRKKIEHSDDESDSDDATDETVLLECNPHISDMMKRMKPQLRAVIESCNTVKAWVQLQVPEMQDGNNFGVEVQGDMLNEVTGVETKCQAFLQALSLYHLSRAEVASKLAKFPGVKDYAKTLEELDVKEFFSLRLIVREARNLCVSLIDTFRKNMDNIVTPRSHSENILVC